MRQVGLFLLAGLLVGPAAWGQDPPKDDKKPPTPQARFAALNKEFNSERSKIVAKLQKASDEEQKKLFEQYQNLGKKFADRFLALAEENPKDDVAADAVFWILANAVSSTAADKASETAGSIIAELPLDKLANRLGMLRSATAPLTEAVMKRAEKETDPKVAELLAWVATSGGEGPAAAKAVDRLLEKFPDHSAISQITQRLGYGGENAEGTLTRILEKATKPEIKANAALALGKVLSAKVDKLGDKPAEADKAAAEAEKALTQVASLAKENESLTKQAEKELKALRTFRVGKPAPEIAGADLDGKEFKLSDYRGKVVLLDFWGHW